jgi:bacteriorhodopsin
MSGRVPQGADMADIDVVPKRRTNIWLWIVLAVIVAVVVFALMGGMQGANPQGTGILTAPPLTSAAAAIT